MNWVLRELGPQAIVYPGQHQHARAAIQELSKSVKHDRVYSQMGWNKLDPGWHYLHAGGAIGVQGSTSEVRVRFEDALSGYHLPIPSAEGTVRMFGRV